MDIRIIWFYENDELIFLLILKLNIHIIEKFKDNGTNYTKLF